MTTLLIIEDNEMNRDMLSRRLQRLGFDILIATDGAEGIDLAIAKQPDLILMDMSLPIIDGWAAAGQLKTTTTTKKIPIIGLSAHAMDGDREKALEAGCNDYETKPVNITLLADKINMLLK